MLRRFTDSLTVFMISVLLMHGYTPSVFAQTLISPNYQMHEHSVGNSGLLDSSSENLRVDLSIGDTSIGNVRSDNLQVDGGSVTTDDPALIFSVNDFDVNFGNFSAGSTSVASSTFTVSNYTSHGYAVYVTGEPPSNGDHELTAMEETGPPVMGQNQFGINLVANTIPSSLGANPDQGDFGFGAPTANYATSNEYRFVNGEAVAGATESGGETTFTISYIANVEGLTPGGRYSGNITLICVGTY